MVVNELTTALIDFLQKTALKDLALPLENSAESDVGKLRFFDGYLPPKSENNDFPFVLVRPGSVEVNDELTTVEMLIVVGTFSDLYDGYRDAVNVMERIRVALSSLPNRTLNARYNFEFPMKASVPDEQAYPYWQVEMQTTWSVRTPINVPPNNGENFYDY